MTVISQEDVLRMGRLSKIKPDAESVAKLEKQFADILSYMDILSEPDTSGVEPLYSPVEFVPATRPDVAQKTCAREELLRNSPEESDEVFVVPRVI